MPIPLATVVRHSPDLSARASSPARIVASSPAAMTCPTSSETAPIHPPRCEAGSASTRMAPSSRAASHQLRRARLSTMAPTAMPAALARTTQAKATGCAQPVSTVCWAMFWKTSAWRKRKGPRATKGNVVRKGPSLSAWASLSARVWASRVSWTSTRASTRRTGPMPGGQFRSYVLRAPCSPVSSASPSSRPMA